MTIKAATLSVVVFALVSGFRAAHCYITASTDRFTDSDCGNDFAFSAFDTWRLIEAGANVSGAGATDESVLDGQQFVPWLFSNAQSNNMRFVRMFGFSDVDGGLNGSPLQTAPGQYDENVFKGFDNVLFNLAKYNLKASIVLVDYWKRTDGVQQYLEWCAGNSTDDLQFFTNDKCKQLYFDFVTTVLNRENTISGIAYKDDPSIFGWEIINEPRCHRSDSGIDPASSDCVDGIQSFIDDAAAHIKSIDKNHMVTVGEEGFFGTDGSYNQYNPTATRSSGQDFIKNHASDNIDYASIHLWPDNWDTNILSIDFVHTWIEQHINAAGDIGDSGKPLVISEFGVKCQNANSSCLESTRNPYQSAVYDDLKDSVSSGKALRGAAFWYLGPTGGSNEVYEYTISFNDSTFNGPVRDSTSFISSNSDGACPSVANVPSNPQTAG